MAGQEFVEIKRRHGFVTAFRHNDGGPVVALIQVAHQLQRHTFHSPRYFRTDHDLASGGARRCQGNVAAVPAHDFDHRGTVMAAGCSADLADCVHTHVHSRIKTQGHFGVGQVIVDRARNADTGHSHPAQFQRTVKAPVAADDHQAVDFHVLQRLHREFTVFRLAELIAPGRPQISARFVCDIQNGFQVQFLQIVPDIGAFAQ